MGTNCQGCDDGRFWTPVWIASLVGLAEWTSGLDYLFRAIYQEAAQTLFATVVGYSFVGVLAGIALRFYSRGSRAVVSGFVAVLVVLLAFGLYLPSNVVVATGALAATAAWLFQRLCGAWVARSCHLFHPIPYAAVHCVWLALLLTFTGTRAPDMLAAVSVTAISVASLTAMAWYGVASTSSGTTRRMSGRVLSLVLVVSCGWLGWRTPVTVPDRPAQSVGDVSILLVTIDTLRADRLGAYGYERARTPNLDELAQNGVVFRQAIAPAVITGPSHVSILTGVAPERHGVTGNIRKLSEDVPTLTDLLRRHGYITAAFPSSWTTDEHATGLASRFHHYNDRLSDLPYLPDSAYSIGLLRVLRRVASSVLALDFAPPDRSADRAVGPATAWLERNAGTPFFVWVHLFDPHLPYEAPDGFLEPRAREYRGSVTGEWFSLSEAERAGIVKSVGDVQHMSDLYDAEVAFTDAQFGRLLEAAKGAAPRGRLLVVATADHGESFGEHGLFWHRDLYDATLRVPLIIAAPQEALESFAAGKEVETQVRLVDIMPTILDLAGLSSDDTLDGRSLSGMMVDEILPDEAVAFATIYDETVEAKVPSAIAVRSNEWKLIRRGYRPNERCEEQHDTIELYNLLRDPNEHKNLIDVESGLGAELCKRAEAFVSHSEANLTRPDARRSNEDIERLRSLGYIR